MGDAAKVAAKAARYIKLGSRGAWESLCFKEATLRLGYHEVPHDMALCGDKEAIRTIFSHPGSGTASDHARQVLAFYDPNPELLWITFADGYLWWCFAEPVVEYLGNDENLHPHGSRLRRVKGKWSNQSICGKPLRILDLNGELTKIAGYQGTICNVKPALLDYLLRKINDEPIPAVAAAQESQATLENAICDLLKLLHWKDFELLVDLIFSQSGWQRVSVVGDGLKTTDIELVLPSTGERAMVQVKSKTNQQQLDEYVEQFTRWGLSRLFYVYHSFSSSELQTSDVRVTLIGPEKLSAMVLRAGLVEWLIKKVG